MIGPGCEFCGEPVESRGPVAYRIMGWEITRAKGGANRIVGRKRQPNRVAHVLCAERAADLERRGLQNQASLL